MYVPKYFEETDTEAIHALIDASPLATFVVQGPAGLVVNHIPFLRQSRDTNLYLLAHVPRANPLSELLHESRPCACIFHGPDGYISPSWYATKAEHGKVVPTWNYAVVHAHGEAGVIDSPEWVRHQIEALTRQNEHGRASPWEVSDAPDDYIEKLLTTLVGIEVVVERLEAKVKASQNQPQVNRESVLSALRHEQPDSLFTGFMSAVLPQHRDEP